MSESDLKLAEELFGIAISRHSENSDTTLDMFAKEISAHRSAEVAELVEVCRELLGKMEEANGLDPNLSDEQDRVFALWEFAPLRAVLAKHAERKAP